MKFNPRNRKTMVIIGGISIVTLLLISAWTVSKEKQLAADKAEAAEEAARAAKEVTDGH